MALSDTITPVLQEIEKKEKELEELRQRLVILLGGEATGGVLPAKPQITKTTLRQCVLTALHNADSLTFSDMAHHIFSVMGYVSKAADPRRLLTQKLLELRNEGVVVLHGNDYSLTKAGSKEAAQQDS